MERSRWRATFPARQRRAVLRNRNGAGGGADGMRGKPGWEEGSGAKNDIALSLSLCLPYLVLWILMETSRLDSLECHPTLDCFWDRGSRIRGLQRARGGASFEARAAATTRTVFVATPDLNGASASSSSNRYYRQWSRIPLSPTQVNKQAATKRPPLIFGYHLRPSAAPPPPPYRNSPPAPRGPRQTRTILIRRRWMTATIDIK